MILPNYSTYYLKSQTPISSDQMAETIRRHQADNNNSQTKLRVCDELFDNQI
jgi:hypothetical protein